MRGLLDGQLKGRTWRTGERLTITDFPIEGLMPTAANFRLPLARFSEIGRCYEGLSTLPGWRPALAAKDTAADAWFAKGNGLRPIAQRGQPLLGDPK
jgi:glutathione S-transferase